MKKLQVVCLFINLITSINFSGEYSLDILDNESSSDVIDDSLETRILFDRMHKNKNQDIVEGNLCCYIIKNRNFAGWSFRGGDFSNDKLININFENADLSNVDFENTIFENPNLGGAILYYPINKLGNPIWEKCFKFDDKLTDIELIRQYSDLINQGNNKKREGDIKRGQNEKYKKYYKEAEEFYEKAKALNKILACLPLVLWKHELKGLNLNGICLRNSEICVYEIPCKDHVKTSLLTPGSAAF